MTDTQDAKLMDALSEMAAVVREAGGTDHIELTLSARDFELVTTSWAQDRAARPKDETWHVEIHGPHGLIVIRNAGWLERADVRVAV